MIKIEVTSSGIKTVHGKKGTPNEGKTFQIPEVVGYAHLPGEKYPTRIAFNPARDEAAPPVGVYMLGPHSFYVNQFGALQLRRNLELIGTQNAAKASA